MKGDEDTLKMLEDVIDQIEISEGRSVTVQMLRDFVVGRRREEVDGVKEGPATEIHSNWWREKQRLIEALLEVLRLLWRGDIRPVASGVYPADEREKLLNRKEKKRKSSEMTLYNEKLLRQVKEDLQTLELFGVIGDGCRPWQRGALCVCAERKFRTDDGIYTKCAVDGYGFVYEFIGGRLHRFNPGTWVEYLHTEVEKLREDEQRKMDARFAPIDDSVQFPDKPCPRCGCIHAPFCLPGCGNFLCDVCKKALSEEGFPAMVPLDALTRGRGTEK